MEESKRALRRHHLERIKAKAFAQAKASFPRDPHLWHSQMIGRYRNRTPCSCWMCGNPRRQCTKVAPKLTRQEREAALRERESLPIFGLSGRGWGGVGAPVRSGGGAAPRGP